MHLDVEPERLALMLFKVFWLLCIKYLSTPSYSGCLGENWQGCTFSTTGETQGRRVLLGVVSWSWIVVLLCHFGYAPIGHFLLPVVGCKIAWFNGLSFEPLVRQSSMTFLF